MANTSTFSRPKKTRMIRKQIYIASEQNAKLKQAAAIQNATEAEVIRDLLNQLFVNTIPIAASHNDDLAWQEFLTLAKKQHGTDTEPYQWRREDAYEDDSPRTRRLYGND